MTSDPAMLKALRSLLIAGAVTSAFALVEWFSPHPPHTWPRTLIPTLLLSLLHLFVMTCMWYVVGFGWAALFAGLARKRNWTPKTAFIFGNLIVPIALPLLIGAEFIHIHRLRLMITLWGFIVMCLLTRPGRLCRTLAFPELTEEVESRLRQPQTVDTDVDVKELIPQ